MGPKNEMIEKYADPRSNMPSRAMLTISLVALVVCQLFTTSLDGRWIWAKEGGWKNPDPSVPSDAKELLSLAEEAYSNQSYADAAHGYSLLRTLHPTSNEADSAHEKLLDAQVRARDYDSALFTIREILAEELRNEKLNRVLAQKFEIGRVYIAGEASRKFLGFSVSGRSKGEEVLRDLVQTYPYSEYSDNALYQIATYYYRERDYDEAGELYKSLIREYPKSEWASLSEYQLGECAFHRLKGVEYDLSFLDEAQARYERYIARDYGGEMRQKAHDRLREIDELRAGRNLVIARFYIKEHRSGAARHYLEKIRREYPKSKAFVSAKKILSHLDKIKRKRKNKRRVGEAPLGSTKSGAQDD